MSDSIHLTRQELYDRVWSTPAWKLGPELGLSGRGLAKRCAREGIPVPQRGYWAKLQVGKAPARTPLIAPWPPEVPPKSEARRVNDAGQHQLIDGAREHLLAGRKTDEGYLKPRKRLIVDVYVTEDSLPSALELTNVLLVALEGRDHPVVISPEESYAHRPNVDEREKGGRERYSGYSWSPARPTVATIGTVVFGLTLFELSEDVEVQYVDGEYVRVTALTPQHRRKMARNHTWTSRRDLPSGRLCLRAYSPHGGVDWQREWREAKPGQLLPKVNAMIKELEREAPTIVKMIEEAKRQAELQDQRWEAEHRKWEREREEQRRREALDASRGELFEIIEAWAEAKRIEKFFDDATRRSAALDEGQRPLITERLQRARAMIGGTDALTRFASWKAPDER